MSARQLARLKKLLGIEEKGIDSTEILEHKETQRVVTLPEKHFASQVQLINICDSNEDPMFKINEEEEKKYQKIREREYKNKEEREKLDIVTNNPISVTEKDIQVAPRKLSELFYKYYFSINETVLAPNKNTASRQAKKRPRAAYLPKRQGKKIFPLSEEVAPLARKYTDLKEQVATSIEEVDIDGFKINLVRFFPGLSLLRLLSCREVEVMCGFDLKRLFFSEDLNIPSEMLRKNANSLPGLLFYLNYCLKNNKLKESLETADLIIYSFEREMSPFVKDYLHACVLVCNPLFDKDESVDMGSLDLLGYYESLQGHTITSRNKSSDKKQEERKLFEKENAVLGSILFQVLGEVLLKKIKILCLRNEYSVALETAKVLFNLTFYRSFEDMGFLLTPLLRGEESTRTSIKPYLFCSHGGSDGGSAGKEGSKTNAKEFITSIHEIGSDFFKSSILVEVLALKARSPGPLSFLLGLSRGSSGIADRLSPTLLFSLAYARRWPSGSSVGSLGRKQPDSRALESTGKDCREEVEGRTHNVEHTSVLADWSVLHSVMLTCSDCLTLGVYMFPEFCFYLAKLAKEKYFGVEKFSAIHDNAAVICDVLKDNALTYEKEKSPDGEESTLIGLIGQRINSLRISSENKHETRRKKCLELLMYYFTICDFWLEPIVCKWVLSETNIILEEMKINNIVVSKKKRSKFLDRFFKVYSFEQMENINKL